MKRTIVAMVMMAGSAGTTIVSTAWLFACCILPLHAVMHRVAPLCRIACAMHQTPSDDQPSTAAPARQRSPQRAALGQAPHLASPSTPHTAARVAPASVAGRSFVTLGALRCDDDVGLHTLFATFLI